MDEKHTGPRIENTGSMKPPTGLHLGLHAALVFIDRLRYMGMNDQVFFSATSATLDHNPSLTVSVASSRAAKLPEI